MLTDYFEPARLMQRVETPDELGGLQVEYKPVLDFQAGFSVEQSTEAIIADRVGAKTIYKIFTLVDDELEQHDIVLRLSDGLMLRVTGRSMKTPAPAQLQYRVVTAEVVS